jgi:hypothetical protein
MINFIFIISIIILWHTQSIGIQLQAIISKYLSRLPRGFEFILNGFECAPCSSFWIALLLYPVSLFLPVWVLLPFIVSATVTSFEYFKLKWL